MSAGWRERARAALPLELACLALVLVATSPLWLGRTWFLADLRMYALPDLARLKAALAAGELRAWDPALFCGYPALAALCAAAFYPPTLLCAGLLPPLLAIKALIVLHAWWLARGAVALVRELAGGRRAGLLAATAMLLGGSWSGHALDLNVMITLGWTPWVLLLAARSGRRGGWIDPLLLAGAYGLLLFQTMPQWALYLAGMALVTAAATARAPVAVLRVGLALGAAGLLAMPLILPGLDYLRTYPRTRPGGWYAFATAGAIELVDLPAWLTGARRAWVEPFFPGLAVWSLALLRLLQPDRRAPAVRIGAPLAAAGLLLCGGDGSPLFRLLVHVPPLSMFRCPGRVLYVTEVGLALLAAGGLDLLLRGQARPGPRRAAPALALLALLAALLAGAAPGWPLAGAALGLIGLLAAGEARAPQARRAALALALGGLTLELGLAHRAQNPSTEDAELLTPPPLVAPIQASPDRRLLDLAGHEGRPYVELVRRLRRNCATLWGVEYVSGYESLPPLAQEALLLRLSDALARDPRELAALCARLSIPWVIVDDAVELPGLTPVARDAGARLWAHPDARPRVYLLPRGAARPLPVQWTRPRSTELQVDCEAAVPARLVAAEAFYPGWSAEVDGAPVELSLEEGLFLAVELPPGRHRVTLRFEDAALEIGLRLGAAGWIAWAAGLGLLLRRRR